MRRPNDYGMYKGGGAKTRGVGDTRKEIKGARGVFRELETRKGKRGGEEKGPRWKANGAGCDRLRPM